MAEVTFDGFIRRPGKEGLAPFKVFADGTAQVDEEFVSKADVAANYPGVFYQAVADAAQGKELSIDEVFPV
jgi:hypothetical protein